MDNRFVRLGTQSMLSEGATFINPDRMDMKHQAAKPAEAKALMDYLLYHEHNPKKALELAAEATKIVEYVPLLLIDVLLGLNRVWINWNMLQ
jgi:tetratricopeptide repeat protein 8